jgi:hypothetical protein
MWQCTFFSSRTLHSISTLTSFAGSVPRQQCWGSDKLVDRRQQSSGHWHLFRDRRSHTARLTGMSVEKMPASSEIEEEGVEECVSLQ